MKTLIDEQQASRRAVRPVSPAAAYIGGKRQLAKTITPIIDATPHDLYAEPFVGMGGIFLKRELVPRAEVINDYSRDVATFFRVLQRHYAFFLDMLKFVLTTRADFERLIATPAETLTDLERAARFLYLQRLAFGGKVSGRNFGMDPYAGGGMNVSRLQPLLEAIHGRLAGVVVECLHWRAFVDNYDRPFTLFYLDPPYYGCEDDYGKEMFARSEFDQLADRLAAVTGKFIVSLNDTPEVRQIFGAFLQRQVQTTYTVAGGGTHKPVSELLISNFELPDPQPRLL